MAQRPRPVFLFVEPSLARHRRLRVALRRRGAHVLMAPTAGEGLDRAEMFPPDAIVVADGLRNPDGDRYDDVFHAAWPAAHLLPDDASLPSEIARAFPSLGLPASLGGAPRVLCVDDDPQYLKSLSRLLERYGYRADSAATSEEAIRSVEREAPALALVDIRMPEMDGIELARRIREVTRGRVPVVLLTALPIDEARARARGSGAACSLSKNAVPDQVVDVLDALIGDVDDDERAFLKIPG
jgi:CheY-like chemotaxis protein